MITFIYRIESNLFLALTQLNIDQLIQQCKNGNQQAQLELYNRYYMAMYNTAYRIVKDRYEAEDIMQDSFLSAFTKLNDLKDCKTFGAWLKRIVINNSIYTYNKSTKYDEVNLDDVLYKIEDDDGIPDDFEFTSLKAQKVLATLKTLKENYRISLTLNLIEGYDYEEICQIMNISYANCRTTISRAKESLKRKLMETIPN